MKNIKILCIAILFSCSTSIEKIDQYNKDNQNINSIIIDGNSILETIDISNIIDTIRIIKIKETEDGLFGGVEKLFFTKEKYVIFDPAFSNKIVIYNTKGEFIKNLVKTGAGPEEMSKLSDLWINENEELEVYDNYLKKIIIYDSNLNVKETKILKNSNYFGSIVRIPKTSQYITYSGYNGFYKNNEFFKLAYLDSGLNEKKLFLPYSNSLNRALISIPTSPFFIINDTIGFTQNFDPTVYFISQNGNLLKKYSLIYSNNPFPLDFENEIVIPNLKYFNSELIDFEAIKKLFSGYSGYSGPWLETSKYAIFNSFDSKYATFTSIYDNEQKEILFQAKYFSETIHYHMQIPPYFYATDPSENRFISIYEGYNVLLLLKESSPFYEMVKNDIDSYYILDVKLK